MIITIATFVFVFVTLTVAGFRAIDTLESHERERRQGERRLGVPYTGPLYNRHGRELA